MNLPFTQSIGWKNWAGAFSECEANSTLISSDVVLSPDEQYTEMAVVQGQRYNLRGAQLKVELDNPDNNEVELVLVSKHDYNDGDAAWGDACGMTETEESCRLKMFMSRSVKITGNQAVFDVVLDLANGADGFDPEKVRNVILKNHGMTPVTVKSVIAMCKHAVGITSCKAEYKDADGAWLVTGYVNNLASITAITTNKKIETITVMSLINNNRIRFYHFHRLCLIRMTFAMMFFIRTTCCTTCQQCNST